MPDIDEEAEDIGTIEPEDSARAYFDATRAPVAKFRVPPLNKGKKLAGPPKRIKLDTPDAIQAAVGRVLKTLFLSTEGCKDLQSASVFIRGSETLLKDMRRAQELELVSKVEELEDRLKLVVGRG